MGLRLVSQQQYSNTFYVREGEKKTGCEFEGFPWTLRRRVGGGGSGALEITCTERVLVGWFVRCMYVRTVCISYDGWREEEKGRRSVYSGSLSVFFFFLLLLAVKNKQSKKLASTYDTDPHHRVSSALCQALWRRSAAGMDRNKKRAFCLNCYYVVQSKLKTKKTLLFIFVSSFLDVP